MFIMLPDFCCDSMGLIGATLVSELIVELRGLPWGICNTSVLVGVVTEFTGVLTLLPEDGADVVIVIFSCITQALKINLFS